MLNSPSYISLNVAANDHKIVCLRSGILNALKISTLLINSSHIATEIYEWGTASGTYFRGRLSCWIYYSSFQ